MQLTQMKNKVLDKSSTIRALIFGVAGSGKTTFAGSFPKPMWLADFDNKLKPLYGIDGIDVANYCIDDMSKATATFARFRSDWKEVKRGTTYKTVVLDSVTAFDRINLKHFCLAAGKDIDTPPTLPIYQDQASYYQYFLTELKGITDKNILLLCHEDRVMETEGGVRIIQPFITGRKIIQEFPSIFEEVWHISRTGQGADDRVLHYKPYKNTICTSTSLKGSGTIILPDIGKVPSAYEVIMAEIQKGA